jgi:hypothetical protein
MIQEVEIVIKFRIDEKSYKMCIDRINKLQELENGEPIT